MDLIIFAHPENKKSHNASVLELVTKELKAKGKKYEIIDLYADKFDPNYSLEEYQLKPVTDPAIKRYQAWINSAERLIFIYPIWWYGTPAILKGFFDRVFIPGFAYNFKKQPSIPQTAMPIVRTLSGRRTFYRTFMKNLPIVQRLRGKTAIVINTFGGNDLGFNLFGKAPERAVDEAILHFCGVEPVIRINWFEVRGPLEIPPKVAEKIRKTI